MNTVQTVLGPIPVEKLGRTLVHEHLFIAFEGSQYDPEATFDRPSFITEAVRRLRELKEHGVSTFVDPCPIDLGRDVTMMKEISEKSEMNIVCTTGFYHEHLGLPGYWRVRTSEDIAALYIREIEKGIGDTGIRPGAIKCASSSPVITPLEEKFMIAASIAQRATGLPIITHTDHVCGPEQQELFTKQGVPLGRCLIGHCCGNADPAYHRRIVEAGSYIGFDRIGGTNHQPDSVRADNIVKLVRAGFISSILMSQDRFCGMRGRPTVAVPPEIAVKIEHMKKTGKYPPPYTHLFTRFLPMLRERGMTDDEIFPILDRNPMEYFRGPAPT